MNLNELLKFTPGNKFMLTEEYQNNRTVKLWGGSSDLKDGKINLPKGLIFTIVSVRLNNQNNKLKCKIIKSKKIVKSVYEPQGVPSKFYTALRHNGNIDEYSYISFYAAGHAFAEFVKNITVVNFNEDYKRITNELTE